MLQNMEKYIHGSWNLSSTVGAVVVLESLISVQTNCRTKLKQIREDKRKEGEREIEIDS